MNTNENMKIITVGDLRLVIDHRAHTANILVKSRIYIWPKSESLVDNLMNRRSRPYVEWKKTIMPAVLESLGWTGIQFVWRQKAGCSCGCSPGFVLEHGLGDVHVTVEKVD